MKAPLVVITGDKLRHKYFAQYLLRSFSDAVLIVERQPQKAWGAHIDEPSELQKDHFKQFEATENVFFSQDVGESENLLSKRTLFELETGAIDDRNIILSLQKINPAIIITLSTSILKPVFINAFNHKIINYHAGLSPYYRGSATNVFPIINREPQYVGVTIHYIDSGIDSGDVIVQGRPAFAVDDNSHTLGCKTLIVGVGLMAQAASLFVDGAVPRGFPQDLSLGRFYPKSAFTDDAIHALRAALEFGVVSQYAREGAFAVNIQEKVILCDA